MTDPLLALVERLEEVLNLPDEKKGLALTGKGYVLLYRIRTDVLLYRIRTDLLALAQAGREREAEQERILVAATLRGDYFSERATAAESALARVRGLVGKWRERAAAGIVGDGIALGYGDCATELEALAAAGQEGTASPPAAGGVGVSDAMVERARTAWDAHEFDGNESAAMRAALTAALASGSGMGNGDVQEGGNG